MGALVLGLGAVNADMLPEVGGKAANLGELLAAGLPVPEGFCLTTAAYLQATAPAFTRCHLHDLSRATARHGPPRTDFVLDPYHHLIGVEKDGVLYCCDGCANNTGCTCRR